MSSNQTQAFLIVNQSGQVLQQSRDRKTIERILDEMLQANPALDLNIIRKPEVK